jgi:hypothetical protein
MGCDIGKNAGFNRQSLPISPSSCPQPETSSDVAGGVFGGLKTLCAQKSGFRETGILPAFPKRLS